MRRNYISPEFDYVKVHGTVNMKEQSSFFGSKMLSYDDSISLKGESIVYYQNGSGEQISLDSERYLPAIVYDTVKDKSDSHTLFLDESQTEYQKSNNSRWIMDVRIKSVLRNYLFATLKKWRTFEGVYSTMTLNNNVDSAINDYILNNLIGRYRFSKIEFYLKSVDLKTTPGSLRYVNVFESSVESTDFLFSKIDVETDLRENNLRLRFAQPDLSSEYCFSYYYNLYFEKI
jgi:hypothetical protein